MQDGLRSEYQKKRTKRNVKVLYKNMLSTNIRRTHIYECQVDKIKSPPT